MVGKVKFGLCLSAFAITAVRGGGGRNGSCERPAQDMNQMSQMFGNMLSSGADTSFGKAMRKVLTKVVPEATSDVVEKGWSFLRESASEITDGFMDQLPRAMPQINDLGNETTEEEQKRKLMDIAFSMVDGIFRENPNILERLELSTADYNRVMQLTKDNISRNIDFVMDSVNVYSRRMSGVTPSRRRSVSANPDYADMVAHKSNEFTKTFKQVLENRGLLLPKWDDHQKVLAEEALGKLETALKKGQSSSRRSQSETSLMNRSSSGRQSSQSLNKRYSRQSSVRSTPYQFRSSVKV